MRLAILVTAALAAPPVAAQSMPGMTMPAAPKAAKPHKKPAPEPAPAPAPAPAAVDQPAAAATPAMAPMPAMTMDQPPPASIADAGHSGTALPAGDAPPPHAPNDFYADRRFDPATMTAARERMMAEEGGRAFHQIMFNLAELQVHDGRPGYRWDGEGWFGGDIARFVVKSEGEGVGNGLEAAEIQALFSRAIGPYFDAQVGIRHDVAPVRTRTYATIGIEGLAPYEIETEAALFVSTRGEVIGRIEGWYDERITQRLVLQPRIELNLAAQDLRDDRIGAGLSDAELGLRLRYEVAREFAPYVGVSYEAKTGRTADFARAAGREATATNIVTGVRFWF